MRAQHDREMREEREARNKAENELAHSRSVLTVLNMLGGQSGAGTGGVLVALGGASLLSGHQPSALNPPAANAPVPPVQPQPVVEN
ncbi:hypothetical protein FRC07_013752 [Ceratobasidium sp. 392]|nr:hypothetical protein FRC07_013752 [Ceratobasidium sp. 392]